MAAFEVRHSRSPSMQEMEILMQAQLATKLYPASYMTRMQEFFDKLEANELETRDKAEVDLTKMKHECAYLKLKQTLEHARTQQEKEEAVRSHMASFPKSVRCYAADSDAFNQDFMILQEYAFALNALLEQHGCRDVQKSACMEAMNIHLLPGSGIAGIPLDSIDCANSAPQIGASMVRPFCQKKGTMLCTRCRLVKYCSRQCQQDHYSAHEYDCKSEYASAGWLDGCKYDSLAMRKGLNSFGAFQNGSVQMQKSSSCRQ